MRDLLCGCAAFGLFFLADWNDWKKGTPLLRWCFPAGAALLSAAVCRMAWLGTPPLSGAGRIFFGVFALGFLILLADALFFALPAGDAYTRPGQERTACITGMYALCRHPGVLWLGGLLVCLWPAAGVPPLASGVFTVLNLLLVLFEDRIVFPARLSGYENYRRAAPFLIPTPASIRASLERNE